MIKNLISIRQHNLKIKFLRFKIDKGFVKKRGRNKSSSNLEWKRILITLIIISTLFLITAGYSNDQIAPAIGLLGTIAGYLLGRIQNNSQTGQKQDEIADKTEIQNIKPIESSDEKNI